MYNFCALQGHLPAEHASDLSEVKNSIVYLYSALNVEHHQLEHERNLKAKLEKLQKEIEPLERVNPEEVFLIGSWINSLFSLVQFPNVLAICRKS